MIEKSFYISFLGFVLVACQPSAPPPTVGSGTLETLLIEHDDLTRSAQDGIIPYNGSTEIIGAKDATAFWAGRNNTLTTPTMTAIQSNSYALEHFRYEEGDSNVVAEHYKVIGGDHRWFNFSVNGKDANLLLWEFFDQFDIYGTR